MSHLTFLLYDFFQQIKVRSFHLLYIVFVFFYSLIRVCFTTICVLLKHAAMEEICPKFCQFQDFIDQAAIFVYVKI